jgi:hypothetical protein
MTATINDSPRTSRSAVRSRATTSGSRPRARCLEVSLRHWDIGRHGVWGGLVATDRLRPDGQREELLRLRRPAGSAHVAVRPALSEIT